MIKKLFKRGLSLLLALVLVATTFFIFDPDLLKIESNAYADVETVEQATPLSAQSVYATETIYLKAGSTAFQYYENFSYNTGSVNSPVDTSGSVYFKNDDASSVKLYVNNAYKKGGSQISTGKLTINSTVINEYAGMANGAAARNNKGTQVASAQGGTLNYAITAGSLADYVENGVYIIEWVFEYVIADKTHYTFAYTGIYAPYLGQAGITYDFQHSGDDDPNANGDDDDSRQEAFSFVTGVTAVAGGNSKSNLIETTNANRKMAPLVGFVGHVNDSTNYTVYGGRNSSHLGNGYFTAQAQGGVAAATKMVNKNAGDDAETAGYAVTNDFHAYSQPDDFFATDGTPYVDQTGHNNLYRESEYNEGVSTGVGYITVDRSRYTNYAQIPNLSVGWLELYYYRATESNNLNWIRVANGNETNYNENFNSNYTINVDTSGTDGSEGNSVSRGLYKINGPVLTSGGLLQIVYRAKTDRNRTFNDHAIITTSNVGLYTTVANQNMLRQQYNSVLNSIVDAQNMAEYYSGSITHAELYSSIKLAAEALVDPVDTSTQQITPLVEKIEAVTDGINSSFGAEVTFLVPEVIYTKPLGSNGTAQLHYGGVYVNNVFNTTTKEISLETGDSAVGKVYFGYNFASNVKISYTVKSDSDLAFYYQDQDSANFDAGTITLSNDDKGTGSVTIRQTTTSASGATTSASLTEGVTKYITQSSFLFDHNAYDHDDNSYWLEWTVSYFDTNEGRQKTATAYTYVYRTFYTPVVATAKVINDCNENSSSNNNFSMAWLEGFHSISTSGSYYSKSSNRAFYPFKFTDNGSYFNFDTTTGSDIGDTLEWFSAKEPEDKYWSDGTPANANWGYTDRNQCELSYGVDSPIGYMTIDGSRYTNLKDVPGVHCGFFLVNTKSSDQGAWYIGDFTGRTNKLGEWHSNASEDRNQWYNNINKMFAVDGAPEKNKFTGTADDTGVKYYGDADIALDKSKRYSIKAVGIMDDESNTDWASTFLACYMDVTLLNKSSLRTALLKALKYSNQLSEDNYNTGHTAWKKYALAFEYGYKALTKLDGTINLQTDELKAIGVTGSTYQAQLDSIAKILSDSISNSSKTGLIDRDETTGEWKSPARKSGQFVVYHKYVDFNTTTVDGTVTATGIKSVGNLNVGENGSYKEVREFQAGDHLYSGYNNTEGYSYFGYYRSETGAEWKGSETNALSLLTGDMAAQGGYGATGDNVDMYYTGENLTYTYVYSKDPAGVFMDFGESPEAFDKKQNLANISSTLNIDTAYTGDDTHYPAGINTTTTSTGSGSTIEFSSGVAKVGIMDGDTDGFNFSIVTPGYNTRTPTVSGGTNLFEFSMNNWDLTSACTTSIDSRKQSITLNTTGYDAFAGVYSGTSATFHKFTEGGTYKLSFDWENNIDESAVLRPMIFYSPEEGGSYSSGGSLTDTNIPVTGRKGTSTVEFTVPSGAPWVTIRVGILAGSDTQHVRENITFSNIKIQDTSDAAQYAKMNDLFFPEIATGLEGGKTYTVAFKSSLRYDDYHWYAVNMYGQPTPEMDWAHEQGTIQVFLSTTKDDKELTNYTVPVRVTTDISTGGTIGTFVMPAGCTVLNMGFCITNDTPLAGWVDDIRIVEGDYLEVGATGESYTLPTPVWEGHTFTGWTEKSSPFNGTLAGDLNKNYTYGVSSDVVLANWQINKYDITFDNEFDFDKGWGNPSASRGELTEVNTDENYFILKTKTDADSPDNTVLSNDVFDLVPGHRYRMSLDYMPTNYISGARLQIHVFHYDNAAASSWQTFPGNTGYPVVSGGVYHSVSQSGGTASIEFVVPEGYSYARLRIGNCDVKGLEIKFSDIYVQDITRGSGTNMVADETVSEPSAEIEGLYAVVHGVVRNYKETYKNDEITALPLMSSERYDFAGWYTTKNANASDTAVTPEYITQAGTNQLWSRWTVHLDYVVGSDAKWKDATKKPASQAGIDIGGTATIGTYVPYKIGYNFGGWKDKNTDAVYQPGETVTLYQCANLEPVWNAATDVSKDVAYGELTALHPGQIYFYAYTPAANNEYVSGYVYDSNPDMDVALYSSTEKTADGNTDRTYGMSGVDSLVSGALTKGTEYYFGITDDVETKTNVTSNFKVTEHTINYTLDAAGGTASSTSVTGHYNTSTPLPTPTRTGYSFTGWRNESNVTTYTDAVTAADNSAIIAANTTSFVTQQKLTALWNIRKYNLNVYAYYNVATSPTTAGATYSVDTSETAGYVAIGERKSTSGAVSQEVTYNDTVTYSATAKTGYTFKGWYSAPTMSGNQITAWPDVADSTDATFTISNMGAADKNVYARFDINEYTVNVYAYSNSSNDINSYVASTAGGTVKLDNGLVSQKYVYGQTFTMTATQETGYAFKGWYYNDNDIASNTVAYYDAEVEVQVTDNLAVNGVINYKARFDVQKYLLSIITDGGTGTPDSYSGYMGATVTIAQPTKPGYTFKGWTLTNETAGDPYGAISGSSYTFGPGNDRATAVWQVNAYPVTVDPNGGTVTVIYRTGGEKDDKRAIISASTVFDMDYNTTASLINPTRTGYTFDKWVVTNSTGSFVEGTAGNASTYRVGLDDKAVIQATWNVQQFNLKVQAWGDAINSEDHYNFEFGGLVKIGADGNEGYTVEKGINYDSTATIYAIPATGYSFLGWQTVEPSTKEALELIPDASAEFETAKMTDKGLQYYAVFAINRYDVAVNAAFNSAEKPEEFVDGTTGGTVTGAGKFSHGETVKVGATPTTGYVFDGWYKGDERVSVSASYNFTITEATSLTARFKVRECSVTVMVMGNNANAPDTFLNNNDAGTVEGSTSYYYGQTTNFTATAKPGYSFVGWYDNNALTGEPIETNAVLSLPVIGNATYFAKFEVLEVAVNLFAMSNSDNLENYTQNADGGQVSFESDKNYAQTASGTSYFGGSYTIYAKAETGYTFDGWYTNSDLSGDALTGSTHNSAGGYDVYVGTADNANGINLYAKFSVGAYNLEVYAYSNNGNNLAYYENSKVGGSVNIISDYAVSGSISVTEEGAVATAKIYFDKTATITAEAKQGYTFEGWYTSTSFNAEPAITAASITTAAMGVNGLKYYAKFEVGSFNIVYNANGGSNISPSTVTAYYNTAFNISADEPTWAGHTFAGWSTTSDGSVEYPKGGVIQAGTIADWYVNKGGEVTLYAIWTVNANLLIVSQVYSTANNAWTTGDVGGTVEVQKALNGEFNEQGYMVVPEGDVVEPYLKFNPAAGFALKFWRWHTTAPSVVNQSTSFANWGTEGTGSTTMPAQTLYVVAFFEIQTFAAEAKAYYNTAAETGVYSYGATGGTVKRGTNGKSASNAVSENMAYGGKVLFIATPARGYSFVGWYGEPTFVNETVTDWGTPVTTDTENYVEIKDTSAEGKETANNYYAVFTINFHKATASVRTYTVREELIYSLTEDKRPGGDPSSKGGVVGISKKPITEDEALSGAWKDDSDWLKTGVYANEIYPYINEIYYGQRVYFAAIANPGYVFGGWYDKQDAEYYGENLVEEENLAYSRIMREGDIYMEAKFVPVSFTLVLDANEGVQGNPTEIIVTYGASFIIDPLSAPTKTGSTFKGWADAPDWTGAEAEEAPYQVKDTILPSTVNAWFNEIYDSQTGTVSTKTIYAVWETAYITINLDRQGATGGKNSTKITLGSSLKSLEKDELPVYEGFVFGGYWSEAGGKGTQYYRANGEATSAVWNTPSNGTIYALWTCPVLESIDYEDGKWVYNYIHREGGTMPVESATAATSVSGVTELAKNDDGLMWWTVSVSETTTEFVEKQLEETPKINLNHYADAALSDLLTAVVETKEEDDREKLNQPQANSYVARMAKDMDLDFSAKKECEVKAPTVKLYETSSKVSKIMDETIVDAANSANGSVYGVPNSSNAASYTYAGKWSYTEQKAVDYYIYTNSPNPVIALEIGDGDVAQTVKENTSSYPTKATVTDNASSFGYVDGEYMTSAVMATDKLDKAWFTDYTTVGIGTAHDYNAKAVVYLTPKFTSSGTQNEIVYTIKASDDAAVVNEGISKAEIEAPENQSLANMQARFESYRYDTRQKGEEPVEKVDSITVCICYHNSMNGESDEGTLDASGPYMQMYMDQVNIDKMINQLHLFRISGGAANHEFPTTGENVYPVVDRNYPYSETGHVLGSFMYVFDATNEPEAAAFAKAEDYEKAKEAIIASVKGEANTVSAALADRSNSNNLHSNKEKLGFVQITSWSNNFFPKTGSYVYVHLIDRWGNVFNRVWECNVDSYPSTIIAGGGTSVYNVFEDGGSNIDTVTLDGANVEFILDDTSSYENGVFTTTGNTVAIATGEANKTYNLTITDKATNTNTVEVTTDGDGVLVLNVEDACADLSAGAYTFTLNGETVNLYSGVTKLVYSASITDISQVGMETVVTVKTSQDVVKLQLVEGIATRTYNREAADSVVENEDGTLTWTINIKPSKGTHSYDLRAKTVNGWETTEYTLTTEVVDEYVATPVALKSVYDAKVEAGEKPVIKARTQVGTQKLQLVYSSGATITYNRSDDIVISTVDDVETWVLTGSAFSKAGEYEVKVRAKYNNEWQDASAKISTVTVTEKVVDTTPVILSVEAQSASAKIYDYVTFKVVTNSNSTKIRFNCPDESTWTFAENPEYTTVNADGTKTWTVAVKFYVLGENDVTFSTRNADGWVDAQTFGTIEITK